MSLLRLATAILLCTGAAAMSAQAAQIVAQPNIPYAGTDNPKQRLDLYLPDKRASESPLPVIVFIHGGGWRNGDRASGRGRLTGFVRTGKYAGVSVGYRLTGEAKWPAQIHDCKAAIRWIHANAATHRLDPSKIAVWGTSAGGHLVSLLGTSGGVAELEGSLGPHLSAPSKVTCVLNFFGPVNFLTMASRQNSNAATAVSALFGGTAAQVPEIAKAASPVTYVTPDDPPFFTAHGADDPTVPFAQAEEIDAALQKAGVPSIVVKVTEAGHGFNSSEVDRDVERFLARHLHGEKVELSSRSVANEPKPPKR